VGPRPLAQGQGQVCEYKFKDLQVTERTCRRISVSEWIVKNVLSQALVAHTCNPSYSGGRDQEDLGSKSAQANSFRETLS
jgi:hypothetical protein